MLAPLKAGTPPTCGSGIPGYAHRVHRPLNWYGALPIGRTCSDSVAPRTWRSRWASGTCIGRSSMARSFFRQWRQGERRTGPCASSSSSPKVPRFFRKIDCIRWESKPDFSRTPPGKAAAIPGSAVGAALCREIQIAASSHSAGFRPCHGNAQVSGEGPSAARPFPIVAVATIHRHASGFGAGAVTLRSPASNRHDSNTALAAQLTDTRAQRHWKGPILRSTSVRAMFQPLLQIKTPLVPRTQRGNRF